MYVLVYVSFLALIVFQVHLSTETKSLNVSAGVVAQYGQNGYRSDCRFSLFGSILVVDHSANNATAWFKHNANSTFTMAAGTNGNYWSTYAITQYYGLWTGYGAANVSGAYHYQLAVCDAFTTNDGNGLGVGLFLSGMGVFSSRAFSLAKGFVSNAYKACNDWRGDYSSRYFRTEGTYTACWNGVYFNQNGASVCR